MIEITPFSLHLAKRLCEANKECLKNPPLDPDPESDFQPFGGSRSGSSESGIVTPLYLQLFDLVINLTERSHILLEDYESFVVVFLILIPYHQWMMIDFNERGRFPFVLTPRLLHSETYEIYSARR